MSGRIVIRCAGGTTIRANEGNIFQATGQTHLFGDVLFEDGPRRLTSNTAVYSSGNGWLHATGNAVFTDAERADAARAGHRVLQGDTARPPAGADDRRRSART